MRWLIIGLVGCLGLSGCSSMRRTSSLLLERQARGPIAEEPEIAKAGLWALLPPEQTQTQEGIEISVKHATPDYLMKFFSNAAVFGKFAGKNPYQQEHLVFYIKIANQSQQKVFVRPVDFVLIDDRGNQYSPISSDYVIALSEFRAPVAMTTRGLLENASPGYFGFSVPIGKLIATKPQGPFAQLQQSALQNGFIYPDVTHDGLLAFWNPSLSATKVRLLATNLKTNFNANDEPLAALEFPFEFAANRP